MVRKKPKTIAYRRAREGKTRYGRRIKLLLANKPRLVVRLTNQRVIAQVVRFNVKGDQVLAGVDSNALEKAGWKFSFKNMPAAYLTGFMLGKKAVKAGVKEAVFDLGFKSPIKGNKMYACLKGAVDAGLEIPCSEEVFPAEERVSGKHIADYAKSNDKPFTKYLKNNLNPAEMEKDFKKVKENIDKDA